MDTRRGKVDGTAKTGNEMCKAGLNLDGSADSQDDDNDGNLPRERESP